MDEYEGRAEDDEPEPRSVTFGIASENQILSNQELE